MKISPVQPISMTQVMDKFFDPCLRVKVYPKLGKISTDRIEDRKYFIQFMGRGYIPATEEAYSRLLETAGKYGWSIELVGALSIPTISDYLHLTKW